MKTIIWRSSAVLLCWLSTLGATASSPTTAPAVLDEQALHRVGEDRHSMEEALVERFNKASDDSERAAVAYLIGVHRVRLAAPLLVERITMPDPVPMRRQAREWSWGRYPMIWPLTQLGSDAIGPICRRLQESDDKLEQELLVGCLRSIDGYIVARFRIRQMLEEEKEPRAKARFVQALGVLSVIEQHNGNIGDWRRSLRKEGEWGNIEPPRK